MDAEPETVDLATLHNKKAGEIVTSIILPVMQAGGALPNVMVLTESVLVGVALACIKLGGDDKVLGLMFERAQQRLAEIRLQDTKGHA